MYDDMGFDMTGRRVTEKRKRMAVFFYLNNTTVVYKSLASTLDFGLRLYLSGHIFHF